MDHFVYRDRTLFCEDLPIPELAAEYGTPLYVYSQAALLGQLTEIQTAFRSGEPDCLLQRKDQWEPVTLQAHGRARVGIRCHLRRRVVPCPPGRIEGIENRLRWRRENRCRDAYGLENGVFLFNVESEGELHALGSVAKSLGVKAPVALRVNPDLPPKTHVKTDTSVKGVKFGLDIETVVDVAKSVVGHPGLAVVGLHMHLGSPILKADPYRAGADKAVTLIRAFRTQGHDIKYLNMGGGFGIHYRKQEALPAAAFAE
jgi:diaminopimelate decarboxylase